VDVHLVEIQWGSSEYSCCRKDALEQAAPHKLLGEKSTGAVLLLRMTRLPEPFGDESVLLAT